MKTLFFITAFLIFSFVPVCFAESNTITVSATVLESLTALKSGSDLKVETNIRNGFWKIKKDNYYYVVVKY